MSTMTTQEAPTTQELETWPVHAEPGTIAYEATRMDRLFPGWWQNIDTFTLNLYSVFDCVLGQGMGDYDEGIRIVDRDVNETGVGRAPHAYCCGHVTLDGKTTHLENWIKEVDKRRVA